MPARDKRQFGTSEGKSFTKQERTLYLIEIEDEIELAHIAKVLVHRPHEQMNGLPGATPHTPLDVQQMQNTPDTHDTRHTRHTSRTMSSLSAASTQNTKNKLAYLVWEESKGK
jgi:hypothetical protein